MHVQPIERVGPQRRSRVRSVVAAFVPLLVLIPVVALGVVGEGRSQAAAAERPIATVAAPQAGAAAPIQAQRAEPPPGPFPERILGIDVLDVAGARGLAATAGESRLLAVAGWLTIGPDPDCAATWRLQCRRTGLLSAATAAAEAALFLETAPGVPLPGLHRSTPRLTSWTVSTDAVVIGRFVDRGGRRCGLRRPICEPVFSVEHLAWLDAEELGPTISTELGVRATGETADVADAARGAVGRASEVLGLTLLSPATLGAVDADAAAALGPGRDGRVWYARLVTLRPRADETSKPVAAWALVDDATGLLIAAAPVRGGPGAGRP